MVEVMNPGNGENLTLPDVQRRSIMISRLHAYYQARYNSNCCPNSHSPKEMREELDKRTEFEKRYQAAVHAKLIELEKIYREEMGEEPP